MSNKTADILETAKHFAYDDIYTEAFDEAIKAVDIKERLDAYMQKLKDEHAKGDLAYLTGEIIDEILQEVYGECVVNN